MHYVTQLRYNVLSYCSTSWIDVQVCFSTLLMDNIEAEFPNTFTLQMQQKFENLQNFAKFLFATIVGG